MKSMTKTQQLQAWKEDYTTLSNELLMLQKRIEAGEFQKPTRGFQLLADAVAPLTAERLRLAERFAEEFGFSVEVKVGQSPEVIIEMTADSIQAVIP